MYAALRRKFGDAVKLPYGPRRAFYLLSRPEHAEHVFVSHQDRYVEAFTYKPLRALLGDGLLTSEATTWERHRRLVQPVFSHRHVQEFGPQMAAAVSERVSSWRRGDVLDVAAEMRTITMEIVGRVLFGTSLASRAEPVGRQVTRLQDAVVLATLLPGSAERTRAVVNRFMPGLTGSVDELVDGMIDARLREPHEHPSDLLDMLLAAGKGEQPFSRGEIRDEVMTLLLAGHETTANTLAWSLVLLSRYPAARERLEDEVDAIVGDRQPTAPDVEKLVWTRAVVDETMRLYPPAWTVERESVVDDAIGGVVIPARNTISVSPYLLHRNEEFWPNPEGFDPSRFLPEQSGNRPKYAFVPFGGGRRICVGAGFAQLEAVLALAAISRRWRLDLVPGVVVKARAGVTLHPQGAVPMTVTTR